MSRNSMVHYKSSELFSILREHFGKDMNLARIKAMSMMICALCKVQRVAYTKLASAFGSEAEAGSSLRRIQRLIAECAINTDLIARLILKLIPVKGPYPQSQILLLHLLVALEIADVVSLPGHFYGVNGSVAASSAVW